ncbi:MAG: immunoglobulin domain-containing protein, partial [Defluviitaleaceae bacterium]|nr:immunoglobulin domain-containing protein [Defluviitaleaceae bacterium]
PPYFTVQPASVTIATGGGASFSVTAGGDSAPAYQWQVSADSGATWGNVTNNGVYSGADTDTLTVTAATTAENGKQFHCVVTNIAGTATSDPATLTVTGPGTAPVITFDPTSQNIAPGGSTAFSVTATGNPAPSYQWQVSADGGATWSNLANGGVYSGAATNILNVTAATVSENGKRFRCVASNTAGQATSAPAMLTVSNTPAAPQFYYENGPTSCTAGDTITFTAQASGVPNAAYQWCYGNGVMLADGTTYPSNSNPDFTVYIGANSASLTLSNVSVNITKYTFYCVASNGVSPDARSGNFQITSVTVPATPQLPLEPGTYSGGYISISRYAGGPLGGAGDLQIDYTPAGGVDTVSVVPYDTEIKLTDTFSAIDVSYGGQSQATPIRLQLGEYGFINGDANKPANRLLTADSLNLADGVWLRADCVAATITDIYVPKPCLFQAYGDMGKIVRGVQQNPVKGATDPGVYASCNLVCDTIGVPDGQECGEIDFLNGDSTASSTCNFGVIRSLGGEGGAIAVYGNDWAEISGMLGSTALECGYPTSYGSFTLSGKLVLDHQGILLSFANTIDITGQAVLGECSVAGTNSDLDGDYSFANFVNCWATYQDDTRWAKDYRGSVIKAGTPIKLDAYPGNFAKWNGVWANTSALLYKGITYNQPADPHFLSSSNNPETIQMPGGDTTVTALYNGPMPTDAAYFVDGKLRNSTPFTPGSKIITLSEPTNIASANKAAVAAANPGKSLLFYWNNTDGNLKQFLFPMFGQNVSITTPSQSFRMDAKWIPVTYAGSATGSAGAGSTGSGSYTGGDVTITSQQDFADYQGTLIDGVPADGVTAVPGCTIVTIPASLLSGLG